MRDVQETTSTVYEHSVLFKRIPSSNGAKGNGFHLMWCQTMIRTQTIHYVQLHSKNVSSRYFHFYGDEITMNDNYNWNGMCIGGFTSIKINLEWNLCLLKCRISFINYIFLNCFVCHCCNQIKFIRYHTLWISIILVKSNGISSTGFPSNTNIYLVQQQNEKNYFKQATTLIHFTSVSCHEQKTIASIAR